MDITVEQTSLIQRTLLAVYLCLDLPRPQILDEKAFERDAAMFDPAGEYDTHHHHDAETDQQGAGKVGQGVADIEDKAHGNNHTHQYSKEQRQTVAVTLRPQRLELHTLVLLHHHCPQERCDDKYRQDACDGIGVWAQFLSRQQLVHKGQREGEHQGDGRRRKDGIHHGVDAHLRQQPLPVALLLRMLMAHRQMVHRHD